jgi:ureidoacrylate peracid hydrolase
METELLGKDRCVLAIIDVQNDFCHGDGAYARLGHDVEPMAAVVPHVAKLLDLARDRDVPRVHIRVAHSDWTNDPAWLQRGMGGEVIDVHHIPIASEGTWGAEFFEIEPRPDEFVLTKHRYSAFAYTPLELIMRAKAATTIVLCGLATHVCVHATARDALFAGFVPVVVEDATGSLTEEIHLRALEDRPQLGSFEPRGGRRCIP